MLLLFLKKCEMQASAFYTYSYFVYLYKVIFIYTYIYVYHILMCAQTSVEPVKLLFRRRC